MATNSVFPWCVQDTRRDLNEPGAQYLQNFISSLILESFFYIYKYIRWHITVSSTILCPHLLFIYTYSTLSCLYALLGVVLRLDLWNFMPAFYIDPNPYGLQDKKGPIFGYFVSRFVCIIFIKFLLFFSFFFILSEIFYQICCRANYLQDMRGSTLKFLFKSMSYFLWIIMILEQEEALVDLVLFYDQTLCTLTVVVSYWSEVVVPDIVRGRFTSNKSWVTYLSLVI